VLGVCCYRGGEGGIVGISSTVRVVLTFCLSPLVSYDRFGMGWCGFGSGSEKYFSLYY
jgi:hypothetical protein